MTDHRQRRPTAGPTRAGPALLLLALASGCHLIEQSDEQAPADQQANVDLADYAEQVDAKLRRFSACRYVVASVIHESWERYRDQVGDDGKPKHRRDGVFVRGIGDNNFRSCERVLEAAKTPPLMPQLEASTVATLALANRYAGLTRELEAYLDTRSSRSEDWGDLVALDQQLVAVHDEWLASDHALQLAIDVRHAENDPVLLGVLESRRSALEVASRKLMIRARPMVRCMTSDESPNAAACKPLHEAFAAACDEFTRTYQAAGESASKVFWMTTFANDVEEFEALAADMQTKLAARKPRGADIQALTDGYASLVRDAETLDFDFP